MPGWFQPGCAVRYSGCGCSCYHRMGIAYRGSDFPATQVSVYMYVYVYVYMYVYVYVYVYAYVMCMCKQ